MKNRVKYIGAMLLSFLILLGMYKTQMEPFHSFSLRFNDINFLFQNKEASEDVVFIAVDEKSVNAFGRWPWDREVLAKAIERLEDADVVALDMVFSEPTENDKLLADSLQKQQNSVCGFFLRQQASQSISELQMEILSDSSLERLASELGERRVFVEGKEAEVNVESILSSCTLSGVFTSLRDRDQLFRRYPVAFSYNQEIYPSIGTQVLRMRLNQDISATGKQVFDLGGHHIPTDDAGFALLNYYPLQSYTSYSFLDLYEGKLDRSALKGKVVILGITEVGVGDIRATPIGTIPGPLLHYTFISNVLNDELISTNPIFGYLSLLLFILLPLCWLIVSSIYKRVGVYILVYMIFFAGAKIAYVYFNFYLDTFYPLLGLLFAGTVSEVILHQQQEEQSRFIEGAFSSYLSPDLLKKLMREPESLALGGEKKELTIFFSDIRSFTTISESMDPQKLIKYLNRYFTPMSDIVMKNKGMIDKYIGDALMAFFNAPVDVKEHAAAACRSSLEMLDELETLNKVFVAEGLPKIEIGVGLNTAEVVVGNMGSDKRFNYTVIGDGVNLASRVEGINKTYGTHIIITEFTHAIVKESFLTRPIERVKVKGKEEEVLLYELLKDTAANREKVEVYNRARELYYQGKKKEASERFSILKEDPLSRYFIQRINDGI